MSVKVKKNNQNLNKEVSRLRKTVDQMVRNDGFMNLFSGFGVEGRDPRANSIAKITVGIDEITASDLYRSDGFGARVINLPANEMVREWITISQDTDGIILEALEALEAKSKVNWLAKQAKLYGGALCVMGLDDGQDLSMPLFEPGLRSIQWMKVYQRHQVGIPIQSYNFIENPLDSTILNPEWYQINPVDGIQPFIVHRSRVLRLDGSRMPDRIAVNSNGWGDSDLQKAYDLLRTVSSTIGDSESIIRTYVESTLQLTGLQEIIQTDTGESAILKRLNIIDLTRHIMNTMLLDENETYTKHSSTVTGIDALINIFIHALAASCTPACPVAIFLGQAPAGLNATGEADTRNWYDAISAYQESWLLPVLNRLVYLLQISKDGPTGGSEIDGWKILFNPLWQPSIKDVTEARYNQAKTDEVYIGNGVLTPEEVAISRFGGLEYSHETDLETDDINKRAARSVGEEDQNI